MRWIFLAWIVMTTGFSLNHTIDRVYEGIMERNEGTPFLIRRPVSEIPGDAVSEGVGYGLLLALACDDQHGFNRILEGAEMVMWNGHYYNWRVDANNQVIGYGAAVDAEQDIAFSLIMADRRIQRGAWREYQDGFYARRAGTIVQNLWDQGVDNRIVRPGYGWGGTAFVNPGYFAPAWYRVFYEFDPSHDWMAVVDRSYEILATRDSALIPDWMQPDGQFTDHLGYNAYGNGQYMYKDAIRVLWRIGTDMLWHRDDRAIEYIKKAYRFLPDIKRANFFQTDGNLIPADDNWVFDNGRVTRPRREHSALTIGMWLIPIVLVGTTDEKKACLQELSSFYEPGADYWGLHDAADGEDIQHNEMYFDQFLAQFGALFLAGRWEFA